MKITATRSGPSISEQMAKVEDALAKSITDVMSDETVGLKEDFRKQIRDAGMGNRLANTWRSDVYPRVFGKSSLSPSGYVQSFAPAIVDAFSKGAHIRPVNGAKWLWIPTKDGRRLFRASGKKKISSVDLQILYRDEIDIVFEGNKGFVFLNVVDGITRGGLRPATKIRVKGRKGMAARAAKRVLLFTLVRGVKMPKLLDIDGPAQKRTANVARRIASEWG